MRLLFNPTNEIFFKKIDDDRMKGMIEINNPTSDTIFAFKIKCTNPQLFMVTPLKGVIKAGQNIIIQFKTNESVNLDFARQLVSKHKFLIEFVPVASQLTIPNYKSQQSDRKKYYINMDSIRGSRLFKDNEKMSIHSGISNKMSYLSMKYDSKQPANNKDYLTPRRLPQPKLFPQQSTSQYGNNPNEQLHQKYAKLKDQLQDLHRQRQQIVNQLSSTRKSSGINLKKIIVFVIFLIIGALLGNVCEDFMEQRKISKELEKKKKEQSKPWRIFSFLDFLYDQVDPNDI